MYDYYLDSTQHSIVIIYIYIYKLYIRILQTKNTYLNIIILRGQLYQCKLATIAIIFNTGTYISAKYFAEAY